MFRITAILLSLLSSQFGDGLANASQPQPASILDSRGRKFQPPSSTPRTVSGFVGSDEVLVELFRDDPKNLLALSPLAKDPRYSAIYQLAPRWQTDFGPELEGILEMKPDLLILASYTRPEWIRQLDLAGVQSFVLANFSSIEDIHKNILTMGALTGKIKEAKHLARTMMARLEALRASCRIAGKRVVNFSQDGSILGKNTIFDSLVNFLGGINAGSDLGLVGWSKLTQESQFELNPDIIISDQQVSKSGVLDRLMKNPVWKTFPAVKQGRVIQIPSRYLLSVSHHIAKAGEFLCQGGDAVAKP